MKTFHIFRHGVIEMPDSIVWPHEATDSEDGASSMERHIKDINDTVIPAGVPYDPPEWLKRMNSKVVYLYQRFRGLKGWKTERVKFVRDQAERYGTLVPPFQAIKTEDIEPFFILSLYGYERMVYTENNIIIPEKVQGHIDSYHKICESIINTLRKDSKPVESLIPRQDTTQVQSLLPTKNKKRTVNPDIEKRRKEILQEIYARLGGKKVEVKGSIRTRIVNGVETVEKVPARVFYKPPKDFKLSDHEHELKGL